MSLCVSKEYHSSPPPGFLNFDTFAVQWEIRSLGINLPTCPCRHGIQWFFPTAIVTWHLEDEVEIRITYNNLQADASIVPRSQMMMQSRLKRSARAKKVFSIWIIVFSRFSWNVIATFKKIETIWLCGFNQYGIDVHSTIFFCYRDIRSGPSMIQLPLVDMRGWHMIGESG